MLQRRSKPAPRPILGLTIFVVAIAMGCAGLPGSWTGTWIGPDVPRTDKAFRDDPDDFQFVIVGDRTGGARPGVFARAMEQINWLQPEFVVCVGDLIEGYTEDARQLEAEWGEIDAMVDELEMPFFYTVGNHDMGNGVMQEMWRQRLGRDYYAFVYKNVLFVSLNTEDPPIDLGADIAERKARFERLMREDPEAVKRMIAERNQTEGRPELPGQVAISDEQVAFVEQTLAAHPDVRWTLVLMHKPAWEYESPAFERIEALLADRPYTVVAGHEHYYAHTKRKGRDYVDMGTTGGVWLQTGPGAFDHVAWVTMTDEGPIFANIRLDGLLDVHGPQ